MTVTQKHVEWISLLEISGPFLAVPVLEDTFPQGLNKVETPFRQRLRSAYDEWSEAVDEAAPDVDAIHQEWVRLVLRDFLEYESSVLKSGHDVPPLLQHHDGQSGVTIRPNFAVMAGDNAKLLVTVTPPGTDLGNPPSSDSWLASPAERLIALCRSSGVPVGLLTNGDQWMLISAPAAGGSSCASWYARLWFQEPVTLQAFYSLLGVRRCFGEATQTLDALIEKSAGHQDEVTDTLGEQVRRAVEVLVQALDRADLDRNRTLLQDVTPTQLFEAGLTVMMRLVVVLCAEERGLLLLGEPIYDQNYAVSTLRSQLVEQASHGLEILERRQDAWSRLLATFRGIYGGISHETLRLPPLGGSLFDPDRFPFLEGRKPGSKWQETPAIPLPIDNRTVFLLLNALQVLEHRSGAQLLSYESLDVEQIGHVYEGLLERTVKRVPDVTLSLEAASTVRKKTGHPELLLSDLETAAATGNAKFEAFLIEMTGRSKSAINKAIASPLPQVAANRLLAACSGDLELNERIKPFASLLRTDSWDGPLVYPADAFVVTHGAGRRETGSHYTPKSLTEPIVLHTLEPLVYIGPAAGKPREEWKLKSPAEILALKVCDMAMGSGAFLVQTCRYLADRLVEAWDLEEKKGRFISIEGDVLDNPGDTELLPSDQVERVLIARRLVANRCLYGVDINPMAVELAKLSLWLVTMMKGRPFNFLDHALKCGDSLLGVSSVQQIENFSLRSGDRQITFATANLAKSIEEASAKRRVLENLPSNDQTQIETKNRLHAETEAATAKVKAVADCLIAFELRGLDGNAYEDQRTAEAEKVQLLMKRDADASSKSPIPNLHSALATHAREQLRGRRPFHWAVEFPEVFASGGFDAFVGNPPFMGGQKITGAYGTDYRNYLVYHLADGERGSADFCAYFYRNAFLLLAHTGQMGMVGTKTIAQGDTRLIGLSAMLSLGGVIHNAISSMTWPGTAALEISVVWVAKTEASFQCFLDDVPVRKITSFLKESSSVEGTPYPLQINANLSFQGSIVLGLGFVLSDREALKLINQNIKNKDVILPYLGGNDLNSRPDQTPSRWVINFRDWPLERSIKASWHSADDKQRKVWLRDGHVPVDYPDLVAADFPDALKILAERVKPERTRKKDNGDFALRYPLYVKWWIYGEKRPALYQLLASLRSAIVVSQATKYVQPCLVTAGMVFDQALIVIATDSFEMLALLNSTFHSMWAEEYRTSLGATTYYIPTTAFVPYPFPIKPKGLVDIGKEYHQARQSIMSSRNEGLTDTYNRFHYRGEQSADIVRLRALHVEMDQTVAAAYGWSDLDLGHGFHATKQGERYTLSEPARREVLDRLLALNHQRYEEEVKAGLHDKKVKKSAKKLAANTPQTEFKLNIEPTSGRTQAAKPAKSKQEEEQSTAKSSSDIEPSVLLHAIFSCAARRQVTDREDLAHEVAAELGFQRLSGKLRDVIASGINSAIRRGLVNYDAKNILRKVATYKELEYQDLVDAIKASIRPGCVYSPDEVLHLAAEYLGCRRLKKGFRERLESALEAAKRRGILTRNDDVIRKV